MLAINDSAAKIKKIKSSRREIEQDNLKEPIKVNFDN